MSTRQQIEEMQNRLEEMREQLGKLEEMQKQLKESGKSKPVYPAMLLDKGDIFLSSSNFKVKKMGMTSVTELLDQNLFLDKETAEAYGDAFRVILELRRCDGAGHFIQNGTAWAYDYELEYVDLVESFLSSYSLFPPFPTEDLACIALEKVGEARIRKAYELLANVKG